MSPSRVLFILVLFILSRSSPLASIAIDSSSASSARSNRRRTCGHDGMDEMAQAPSRFWPEEPVVSADAQRRARSAFNRTPRYGQPRRPAEGDPRLSGTPTCPGQRPRAAPLRRLVSPLECTETIKHAARNLYRTSAAVVACPSNPRLVGPFPCAVMQRLRQTLAQSLQRLGLAKRQHACTLHLIHDARCKLYALSSYAVFAARGGGGTALM